MYEKKFYVAGVKFHELHTILDEIEEGDGLDLVPEPSNKYDPNAIKIMSDGVMLGYIPKKFSAEVSAAMSVSELGAVVEKVSKTSPPWEQLFIKVFDINAAASSDPDYEGEEDPEEE